MLLLIMVFTLFTITNNKTYRWKKQYKEGINQKAADYLISKSNGLYRTDYEDGDKEEMYTFFHFDF